QNALELAGMEADYASFVLGAKLSVDSLIESGMSYQEAIRFVAENSNRSTSEIEAGFEAARDAGLEFSDEYPAEIRLENYQPTLNRINSIGQAIHDVPSYKRIVFDFERTGILPPSGEMPYSKGGRVGGPMGAGDIIPARLSPGEHVWTRDEVNAAGGHAAVEAMRAAVLAGRARFASPSPPLASRPAPSPHSGGITVQNLNIETVGGFDSRQVVNELTYIGAV
ncbi:MAG TPA: hypothetical protein VKY81_04095, partial [Natronosporangium sp.]|nr:hypothetical protein [Natronosporangium sp.]